LRHLKQTISAVSSALKAEFEASIITKIT